MMMLQIIFSSIMYYLERGTFDKDLGIWKRLLYYECPVTVKTTEEMSLDYVPNSYVADTPCRLQERIDNFTAVFTCPYQYPKGSSCTHLYEQR